MHAFDIEQIYTTDMKHNITFALCAVLLLAGFFGLQAVSELHLPVWEVLGLIAAIFLAETPVVRYLNKHVEDVR